MGLVGNWMIDIFQYTDCSQSDSNIHIHKKEEGLKVFGFGPSLRIFLVDKIFLFSAFFLKAISIFLNQLIQLGREL